MRMEIGLKKYRLLMFGAENPETSKAVSKSNPLFYTTSKKGYLSDL